MKPVYKFFVPLFVLALLAISIVGNVFAKNSSDVGGGSREIEAVGVVEAIAPDFWTIEGRVYQITPATEIKGMIQTGTRVKVHAYPGVNGALTAREIEPAASAAFTDDRRDNTNTNRTDDRRKAGEMEIFGVVESITDTAWTIDGRLYLVTAATEIEGLIQPGARVKVHLVQNADGTLTIREVELAGADTQNSGRSDNDMSGDDKSSKDKSGDDRFDDKSNDKSRNGYNDNSRYDDDDYDDNGSSDYDDDHDDDYDDDYDDDDDSDDDYDDDDD